MTSPTPSPMLVRPVAEGDWDAVVRVYNEAVDTGISTADTRHVTVVEKRAQLEGRDLRRYPLWVGEGAATGDVVGWVGLSPYRDGRDAVRTTAELSYYVGSAHRGHGLGSRLVAHALDACPTLGIDHVFAIVIGANTPSIRLLKKFSFREWGRFPGVVAAGDRRHDHLYLGRSSIGLIETGTAPG